MVFVLGQSPVIIDFCGPWSVFEGVHVMSRGMTMDEMMPFELYTVSDRKEVISSGGMKVTPNRLLSDAGQPKVIVLPAVKRGLRFVEGPKVSSGGGLTCGIDLALRVVERYFGRAVAGETAEYMEYQGKGWIV